MYYVIIDSLITQLKMRNKATSNYMKNLVF